jgi:hypothetical protein
VGLSARLAGSLCIRAFGWVMAGAGGAVLELAAPAGREPTLAIKIRTGDHRGRRSTPSPGVHRLDGAVRCVSVDESGIRSQSSATLPCDFFTVRRPTGARLAASTPRADSATRPCDQVRAHRPDRLGTSTPTSLTSSPEPPLRTNRHCERTATANESGGPGRRRRRTRRLPASSRCRGARPRPNGVPNRVSAPQGGFPVYLVGDTGIEPVTSPV